jgi:hypothetical protein
MRWAGAIQTLDSSIIRAQRHESQIEGDWGEDKTVGGAGGEDLNIQSCDGHVTFRKL